MRTLIGLMGIVVAGAGVATLVCNWKIGLCIAFILLGLGLFIDAVRK